MELCIGTVQFGLDYGIKGQKKPDITDAVRCLDYAVQNGIRAIDTASAYGTAQEVVGEFLKRRTIPREQLFLSTKLLPNILDDVAEQNYVKVIRSSLKSSLEMLHTNYVDAYLLHSARYVHYPKILDALYEMKREGLARKVGVSVYEPEEAAACINDQRMEFIQAPYSIFDHRMKEADIFNKAKCSETQIDVRSAFIQGLITMDANEIPKFLERSKPIIEKIEKISKESGYSRIALAMGYIKKEEGISHLVFGVDSMEQLMEDICVFQRDIPNDLYVEMEKEFEDIDTDIVMPSLWKKDV